MESMMINHKCEGCGKRVERVGYLHISKQDVLAYQVMLDDWAAQLREGMTEYEVPEEFGLPQGAAMLEIPLVPAPKPPRWMIHHRDCDPDLNGDDYFVPIEEITSWPGMTIAAAVLMSEPWIELTNFREWIHNLCCPLIEASKHLN